MLKGEKDLESLYVYRMAQVLYKEFGTYLIKFSFFSHLSNT